MKILLLSCTLACLISCDTKKNIQKVGTNTDSSKIKVLDSGKVIVTELPTIQEKIDFTNSPNLILRILPNKYQAYFHNDSLTTNNIAEVDKFIAQHIETLNKEKTLVIGEPDGSLKYFKDLKAILKKYEIYKFRIKTQEEVY